MIEQVECRQDVGHENGGGQKGLGGDTFPGHHANTEGRSAQHTSIVRALAARHGLGTHGLRVYEDGDDRVLTRFVPSTPALEGHAFVARRETAAAASRMAWVVVRI